MIHGIKRGIYCCLIGCALFTSAVKKANAQIARDSLTTGLQQAFVKDSLPGLCVVLVDAHKVIYQKSFGFADMGNQIPYTTSTVQNVGSVSKTVIALALMKAIELQYFTLETNINDILPFKVVNPNQPDSKITIRELANHTSGIVDNPAIYPNTYQFYPKLRSFDSTALNALQGIGYRESLKDSSLKTFFYNYLAAGGRYYSKANFGEGPAGSTSSYSNIGSALVAYLIEIRSHLSYAGFTTNKGITGRSS